MMRRLARCKTDERGVAMVTVIATSATLLVFAGVIAAQGINSAKQTRRQRVDEQVLHVADAGFEWALFQLAEDPSFNTGQTVPLTFASTAAEKQWALAAAAPMAPTYSVEGEWVVIKPINKAVIYSIGYAPNKASPERVRVLRGSFDSGPALTGYSILTHDDLVLGSKLDVTNGGVVGGGKVHTNGDLTGNATGSISGTATSSGTYSLPNITSAIGSGGSRPTVEVPDVKPRNHYAMSQYDLCPDGTVKAGPAYSGAGANGTGVPCNGATLANATSIPYRGWRMTGVDASKGAIWIHTARGYDGVFYIFAGSARIIPDKVQHVRWTIFAEGVSGGSGPGGCPVIGGDIEMVTTQKSHHISPAPSTSPLLFVAGRDLKIDAEWHPAMNQGVILAHEQIYISNKEVKLTGSLIAYDHCNTGGSMVASNFIGAASIRYGGYSIPPGIPRLYNWAEL